MSVSLTELREMIRSLEGAIDPTLEARVTALEAEVDALEIAVDAVEAEVDVLQAGMADGTAAAPGLHFASDVDTGFWRVAADNIGFATGGADRFRISTGFHHNATGAVWIPAAVGTAALPAYSFVGDTDIGMFRVGANQLGFSTAGVQRLLIDGATQFTATLPWRGQNGTAAAPAFSFSGDTNTGFYWDSADVIGVALAGVSSMFFTATSADESFGSNNDPFQTGFTGIVGFGINTGGFLYAARVGVAAFFGRTDAATGGGVVDFRRQGTQVGSIALSAGATTYNVTSDSRLKKSIKEVAPDGLLEAVLSLRVKEYSFKGDKDGRVDRGLLAQEVFEVYPEAVTPPNDEGIEHWMIDYGRLTPLLLGAIQGLAARVKELEAA